MERTEWRNGEMQSRHLYPVIRAERVDNSSNISKSDNFIIFPTLAAYDY